MHTRWLLIASIIVWGSAPVVAGAIVLLMPIDFRELKLFSNFSDRRYFDVDRLIESTGNMPPELILQSFDMLRPASRLVVVSIYLGTRRCDMATTATQVGAGDVCQVLGSL
jgi:hypothetical protein